jgi:hypothetical protein
MIIYGATHSEKKNTSHTDGTSCCSSGAEETSITACHQECIILVCKAKHRGLVGSDTGGFFTR